MLEIIFKTNEMLGAQFKAFEERDIFILLLNNF